MIDPPDLAPVDRSFLLVQSDLYLGEVDTDKLLAEDPDLVVFNGYANQYDHRTLRAQVGERVRVWVLDAGPARATSSAASSTPCTPRARTCSAAAPAAARRSL